MSGRTASLRNSLRKGLGELGTSIAIFAALVCHPSPATATPSQDMIAVPSGEYTPFFERNLSPGETPAVHVSAFLMDPRPVTNRQFLEFVATHPEWRKSRIKSVFADSHYLAKWTSDVGWGKDVDANAPVTNVSWFAAKAYCTSRHMSLPTTDQWEYALADKGRMADVVKTKVLSWYAKANARKICPVGQGTPNGFGIYDLVGLVWEWTLDFSSFISSSELRGSANEEKTLFCGGASLGALDAADFAAFMRFSMRASLKASYTTNNLGFRCVANNP